MDHPIHTPVGNTSTKTCTIPGCDGFWHYEGTCVAPMAEIPFGEGSLVSELVAEAGQAAYVTIYGFNLDIDGTAIRTSAPAELYAQAARFRSFADAIETTADHFARIGDSDPDMDEALRRVRTGAGR